MKPAITICGVYDMTKIEIEQVETDAYMVRVHTCPRWMLMFRGNVPIWPFTSNTFRKRYKCTGCGVVKIDPKVRHYE